MPEIQNKTRRLADWLDQHELDGVLLSHRNNFAWITGGRYNYIANNSAVGVAAIYATRDRRVCITNTIEAPRYRDEELAGTGIEVVAGAWYDRADQARVARELAGNARIAADADDFGLKTRPFPWDDFVKLRWPLEPEEIERYKEGGRRTSVAIEQTCREIKPGMTEHQVAGVLADHVHAQGVVPVVNLIASDQRIRTFRHPIPTDETVERYVMLVICSEYCGLISNMTRFVSFGPLSEDIKRRQQAVVNVDAVVNLATRAGRTLGEIFGDLAQAYADNGFADEWKLHHQGGSTGYAGREALGVPESNVRVVENQAFAWNPSITGVKSEDTVVITSSGVEMVTDMSPDWPTLTGKANGQTMRRPDILVR